MGPAIEGVSLCELCLCLKRRKGHLPEKLFASHLAPLFDSYLRVLRHFFKSP